ncbi:RIP metalloprotease RseP N-terminal domain protein [Candidatus Trichorickettsia mobilis]|uniref:RIP metalloprotease RseP N-terminal domain protein n=1 Tax=Candidatus Trichorickettsia mobilis TaxID=1346319 RepID=A0ABZ0UTU8_9RICK|nr:RIP metalloprotease RseP N-terminal domain protein [Candidatus Trichorickettsia mobilis]
MLTIIGFILAMGLLVFVHEFGHYYIAKAFGVKIEEFSIGFGKELFVKIDKNGVRWKICAIPLGGFVKMYGDCDITSTAKVTSAALDFSFYHKPWYIKFLIVVCRTYGKLSVCYPNSQLLLLIFWQTTNTSCNRYSDPGFSCCHRRTISRR